MGKETLTDLIEKQLTERHIPPFLHGIAKRMLHIKKYEEVIAYCEKGDFVKSGEEFLGYNLRVWGERHLEQLKKDGKQIFVISNHRFGGPDGVSLINIIEKYFDAPRFIVNKSLAFIEGLKKYFIQVDNLEGATRDELLNLGQEYEKDNPILQFPAGLVSKYKSLFNHTITDAPWKKQFVSKAKEYKKTVVPVYFGGRNSKSFYWICAIRKAILPKLKVIDLLLLSGEMFKKQGHEITMVIGPPIPHDIFSKYDLRPQGYADKLKEYVETVLPSTARPTFDEYLKSKGVLQKPLSTQR